MTDNLDDYISGADLADFLGVTERTLAHLRGLRPAIVGSERRRVYHKPTVARWLARRMELDHGRVE